MEQQTTSRAHDLRERFLDVRQMSLDLVAPLESEDFRIQSMPDVSPPWWNLGHTTWFFAKNLLEPRTGYRFPEPSFEFVLNSYYEAHGPRLARHHRGLVTRPSTEEILELRRDVDRRMLDLLETAPLDPELALLIETGIHHEQQHQELLVTEIKHIRSLNPAGLRDPYRPRLQSTTELPAEACWQQLEGGITEIGNLEGVWSWDNELPTHKVFLAPYALADRLVTVGEFLEFLQDGGYRQPLLWLANGWQHVCDQGWEAPLYWRRNEQDQWRCWTLAGDRALNPAEPVCHLSFYEADAYANWRAANHADSSLARLPTELEWEHAARQLGFDPEHGNFLEDQRFHPQPASVGSRLRQAAGDLWEWTSSHYEPYPGYRPFAGALMEYNGKFMDNQRVLRGGSCATPRSHIRPSYRNFWPAETRFQFTGLRLARSL